VNARRQRIARFQEEEEGVTAAKLGRLWSETVKEILVRLFEEKLPFALPSRFAFCLVGSLTRREACPSSDVDAFLLPEVATPKIRDCFAGVVEQVAAAMVTTFEGAKTGLRFCAGGLSPECLMNTPADLLNEIQGLEAGGKPTPAWGPGVHVPVRIRAAPRGVPDPGGRLVRGAGGGWRAVRPRAAEELTEDDATGTGHSDLGRLYRRGAAAGRAH
jgi:hypothetical protein